MFTVSSFLRGLSVGKTGSSQRYTPKTEFICTHCSAGDCNNCSDIMRIIVNLPEICQCARPEHSGEPVNQQILDPETGDVHAPGMVIHEDGSIEKDVKPSE